MEFEILLEFGCSLLDLLRISVSGHYLLSCGIDEIQHTAVLCIDIVAVKALKRCAYNKFRLRENADLLL